METPCQSIQRKAYPPQLQISTHCLTVRMSGFQRFAHGLAMPQQRPSIDGQKMAPFHPPKKSGRGCPPGTSANCAKQPPPGANHGRQTTQRRQAPCPQGCSRRKARIRWWLTMNKLEDVLHRVVIGMGGPQKVGMQLFPEMDAGAASRRVSDCLNPNRAQQFHPHHVLFILQAARQDGDHYAMNWLAHECGYAAPAPLEPEVDTLKRQYLKQKKRMDKIAKRIEALECRGPDAGGQVK